GSTLATASTTFFSMNVTVPPGMPPPGATAATVAVNVTACPVLEGFNDDVKLVVVLALFTVCVSAADMLPLKFGSPAYTAVVECEPTARLDVVNVAIPPGPMLPVPSAKAPSMNVTSPVGDAAPEVTVAEKVTDWPKAVGFTEAASVVVVAA